MRKLLFAAVVAVSPLMLTACGGSDDKTVIVNPPPGQSVVVPAGSGTTRVCPQGAVTC